MENTHKIKLNNQGHIKLFPVKKEESWDEIRRHCFSTKGTFYSSVIFDWLENNYNPPTKK